MVMARTLAEKIVDAVEWAIGQAQHAHLQAGLRKAGFPQVLKDETRIKFRAGYARVT